MCVTSLLFGHCHRWNEADLLEYCNIFKVSLTEAFKSINFIGCDENLPSELKRYLYYV